MFPRDMLTACDDATHTGRIYQAPCPHAMPAGRSGVHTHMTNTRITDPEILERRYPVVSL